MTSGGLARWGRSARGDRRPDAHPRRSSSISPRSSILMNIQEMSTAAQYDFRSRCSSSTISICMVRQCRSCSWRVVTPRAIPGHCPTRQTGRGVGASAARRAPAEVDAAIGEMLRSTGRDPRCRSRSGGECFPMIPSGAAPQRDAPRPEDKAQSGLGRGHGARLRSPRWPISSEMHRRSVKPTQRAGVLAASSGCFRGRSTIIEADRRGRSTALPAIADHHRDLGDRMNIEQIKGATVAPSSGAQVHDLTDEGPFVERGWR